MNGCPGHLDRAQSSRAYPVISTGTREACVVERSILASIEISPLRGCATAVEMTEGVVISTALSPPEHTQSSLLGAVIPSIHSHLARAQ